VDQWKRCLHCGTLNEADNYSCECGAGWTDEYRSVGLRFTLNEREIEQVRRAFINYQFDDGRGILQYPLLPYRQYAPDGLFPVGATPLYRLEGLGDYYERDIFIKNEGDNPSGCFKDRETLACLLNSRRQGLKKAVIYSSGNAAASAALFAEHLGIQLITFVAGDTYEEKIRYIQEHGSDVVVVGGPHTTFEEGFRLYARLNAQGVFQKQGFDNWAVRNPYRVQGDKTTAVEIARQLLVAGKDPVPDYVIVPSANGSHLAGLWRGFQEMEQLGIIDSLPKMVVAGIQHANPICEAVRREQQQEPVVCTLEALNPQDAEMGSIIVAEEGYDSVEAAKAVIESGGTGVEVGAASIQHSMVDFLDKEKELALDQSILPEPASCIAIAAVKQLCQRGILQPGETAVPVITGHGIKAQATICKLLLGKPKLIKRMNRIVEHKRQQLRLQPSKHIGRRVNVRAQYSKVRQTFLRLHAHTRFSTV
jgi:threonine synthase